MGATEIYGVDENSPTSFLADTDSRVSFIEALDGVSDDGTMKIYFNFAQVLVKDGTSIKNYFDGAWNEINIE